MALHVLMKILEPSANLLVCNGFFFSGIWRIAVLSEKSVLCHCLMSPCAVTGTVPESSGRFWECPEENAEVCGRCQALWWAKWHRVVFAAGACLSTKCWSAAFLSLLSCSCSLQNVAWCLAWSAGVWVLLLSVSSCVISWFYGLFLNKTGLVLLKVVLLASWKLQVLLCAENWLSQDVVLWVFIKLWSPLLY